MDLKEILSSAYTANQLNTMRLDRVDIVSPYISKGFFEQLLKFKPVEVSLVVDAGCSVDDIKKIINLLGDNLVNETVRLGKSVGLVHSKLFLFHWSKSPNGTDNRLLLWGSCNATDGGFGRNAEIFSWIKFCNIENIDHKKDIIRYFHQLNNSDCAEQSPLNINEVVSLILPKISLANYGDQVEIDSFDLWLQNGMICHEYTRDSNFSFIKITLKKPLPVDKDMKDAIEKNRFKVSEQLTISYDYLCDEVFDDVIEKDPGNFRAQYFIETIYGKWTSQKCYDALHDDFYASGRALREQYVNKIHSAKSIDRTKWEDSFLNRMKQIAEEYNIKNPGLYFEMTGDNINTDYYRDIAKRQIDKDWL